jgi:gliding motility-associated-like protein
MKRLALLLLAIAPALPYSGMAQQILNGSFEGAGRTCSYNLSNSAFTTQMPNVVGFGEKNELDILNASCGFGPSYSGPTFLGMFCANGITDAVALKLSEPMTPGKTYTLQFHLRIGEITNGPARVSVGLTSNPSSHGELLHTVFELKNEWTRYQFQFKPPIQASYLTVLVECAGQAWILVDDFSFVCPTFKLGRDSTYCAFESATLDASPKFDNYQWSTGETTAKIVVREPGLYWVEAKTGGCSYIDSIHIRLKPALCNCKMYIPNIFSPNQDQHNDTWSPVSPCELLDYEVLVFDRWGGMVFRSQQISESWDGRLRGQNAPNGIYAYRVRYRFKNLDEDTATHQSAGLLQLLR